MLRGFLQAATVAFFCVVVPCVYAALGHAQQSASGPIPVGTVEAVKKPVSPTANFVGRVQAVNRVDVVARITGYLEAVLFTEGDAIKEGQPLYRIERDQFQAAVDQAEGALAATQAKKLLTAIQFARNSELMKSGAGTVVARDQSMTADRAQDAQLLIDQASVKGAQINLGYTDIVSPISGRIGRTSLTKGNVVSPQTGVLTTLVSIDPTYVSFPVSQRSIMRARGADHPIDISGIKVSLQFTDGTTYSQIGKIDFVDVTVDKATDTVQVRAVFANPKGSLIDGQLVTVSLEAAESQEQVVVPQAALITDQQGVYVFIVEDGKVAIRRVKTGAIVGEDIQVSEGLSGGERVIVEGMQSVRQGTPVQAKPATPSASRS